MLTCSNFPLAVLGNSLYCHWWTDFSGHLSGTNPWNLEGHWQHFFRCGVVVFRLKIKSNPFELLKRFSDCTISDFVKVIYHAYVLETFISQSLEILSTLIGRLSFLATSPLLLSQRRVMLCLSWVNLHFQKSVKSYWVHAEWAPAHTVLELYALCKYSTRGAILCIYWVNAEQWWANLDQASKDLDKPIFRDLLPTPIPWVREKFTIFWRFRPNVGTLVDVLV